MPALVLLPLGAAILHTIAALCLKRAMADGVRPAQVFQWVNWAALPVFVPMIFWNPGAVPWHLAWQPLAVALFLVTGDLLTVAALRRGDVSLVGPLMGTKVIFVALGMVAWGGAMLGPRLWIAAIMTAVAVFVLGAPDMRGKASHSTVAILLVLTGSMCFASADVWMQGWAPGFGRQAFISLTMIGVPMWGAARLFVEPMPMFTLSRLQWKWLAFGCAAQVCQRLLMSVALSFYHNATVTNIVYSSRGLWALLLVGLAGAAFGNRERRDTPRGAWMARIVGTVLLTSAIVLALLR